MVKAYNPFADAALSLTRQVDSGIDPNAVTDLATQYPRVTKSGGEWIVREIESNKARKTQTYKLHALTGTNDPELIGLRDPDDPTRMNTIKRPVESAKGPAPKP